MVSLMVRRFTSLVDGQISPRLLTLAYGRPIKLIFSCSSMAIRLESASNYLLYVRFANDACASLTTMTMTNLIELVVELQMLFDALSKNA